MPDAPWVPPFFPCGECGGTIGRWPITNILKQQTWDWRHVTVPPGTGPHRAILGTPVSVVPIAPVAPEPAAESSDDNEEGDESSFADPDVCPPPEVVARPARPGEAPPSALSIARLAADNGWTVETWYMRGTRMSARWKVIGVVSNTVVRARRDGHRLVASWQTKPSTDPGARWTAKDWPGTPFAQSFNPWKFDEAYSLTREARAIGSPELRKLIEAPRMICEDCGRTAALHESAGGSLVCYEDNN